MNKQKISQQNNRAFQSVNNFFNPRTAGAKAHPIREKMQAYTKQSYDQASADLEFNQKIENSIFLKNTFSPRINKT